MPLVRISHAAGKSAASVEAMSTAVHTALMECFGVSADDYWQIVTEHVPGSGLVGPAEFIGITHSANMVFIQITCTEGRSLDQKKALYAAIAGNVANRAGIKAEDVIINLTETKRENWSFGNGKASFV